MMLLGLLRLLHVTHCSRNGKKKTPGFTRDRDLDGRLPQHAAALSSLPPLRTDPQGGHVQIT